MSKTTFIKAFYSLTLFFLTTLFANQTVADTCPNLSNSDQIPSGWQIFNGSPANPDTHNQFYQAIYDYKLENMYTAHRVICAYHTNNSFFALISDDTYPPPSTGLQWQDYKEHGLYICRQQTVENCPF